MVTEKTLEIIKNSIEGRVIVWEKDLIDMVMSHINTSKSTIMRGQESLRLIKK